MAVPNTQISASIGVSTIGSRLMLSEVFITIGTPVRR